MIHIPPAATVLALAQSAALDRPDALERWVAILSGVAQIVIALALIAIFLAVIPLALAARRAQKQLVGVLQRLERQAEPVMGHARSVADNVDYVSTAIRSDVERLRERVTAAQERLERAAGGTEERIARFNSLLDVVQDEAESLFIGTASTIRGFRAGAEALRGRSRGPARIPLTSEEEDPERDVFDPYEFDADLDFDFDDDWDEDADIDGVDDDAFDDDDLPTGGTRGRGW